MWSIGNEIPMRRSPAGYNLSHVLSDYVRTLDSPQSGRAVTSAYPGVSDDADKFFAPLDVAGYNYSPNEYVSDHTRVPSRIMVGTESFPNDSFKMWDLAWSNEWVLGDFIWCVGLGSLSDALFTFPSCTLYDGRECCSIQDYDGLHRRVGHWHGVTVG
jgi:beta-galactosidase